MPKPKTQKFSRVLGGKIYYTGLKANVRIRNWAKSPGATKNSLHVKDRGRKEVPRILTKPKRNQNRKTIYQVVCFPGSSVIRGFTLMFDEYDPGPYLSM